MNNQILPQHVELSANHNGSVKRAEALVRATAEHISLFKIRGENYRNWMQKQV